MLEKIACGEIKICEVEKPLPIHWYVGLVNYPENIMYSENMVEDLNLLCLLSDTNMFDYIREPSEFIQLMYLVLSDEPDYTKIASSNVLEYVEALEAFGSSKLSEISFKLPEGDKFDLLMSLNTSKYSLYMIERLTPMFKIFNINIDIIIDLLMLTEYYTKLTIWDKKTKFLDSLLDSTFELSYDIKLLFGILDNKDNSLLDIDIDKIHDDVNLENSSEIVRILFNTLHKEYLGKQCRGVR